MPVASQIVKLARWRIFSQRPRPVGGCDGDHDDVALLRAAYAKAPTAQRRALGAALTPAECAQEKEEEGEYDLIVRGRFGAGRTAHAAVAAVLLLRRAASPRQSRASVQN